MESAADLPGSLHTRRDYGNLLLTFRAVHVRLEAAVFAPQWHQGWRELDIDIANHRQLDLLADDLATLSRTPRQGRAADRALLDLGPVDLGPLDLGSADPGPVDLASGDSTPGSLPEALGCLYVLEGSAIGRRVLSPLLQKELGDIPTAFFDGVGRHPRAWRDVQRSIASLAAGPEQQPAMVSGARTAFQVFLHHLRRRSDRRVLSPA